MIKAQAGIKAGAVVSPWRNPMEPTNRHFRRTTGSIIILIEPEIPPPEPGYTIMASGDADQYAGANEFVTDLGDGYFRVQRNPDTSKASAYFNTIAVRVFPTEIDGPGVYEFSIDIRDMTPNYVGGVTVFDANADEAVRLALSNYPRDATSALLSGTITVDSVARGEGFVPYPEFYPSPEGLPENPSSIVFTIFCNLYTTSSSGFFEFSRPVITKVSGD